jgi:hypothetical protein
VKKKLTLFGFFAALAVCGHASLCNAVPRKITEAKRTFAQRLITSIAESTVSRAPRCETAWTAMGDRSHMTASRHSSTRVRSLGVRWKVEGKVASEIPVASQKDGLPTAGKGCSVRA